MVFEAGKTTGKGGGVCPQRAACQRKRRYRRQHERVVMRDGSVLRLPRVPFRGGFRIGMFRSDRLLEGDRCRQAR
jgi:hypothetical protein